MVLSEELLKWRAERPDEWKMDEFIRKAEALERTMNIDIFKAVDFLPLTLPTKNLVKLTLCKITGGSPDDL